MACGLIVILWLLCEAILLFTHKADSHEADDQHTLAFLVVALLFSLTLATACKLFFCFALPWPFEFIGATLIAAGIVLRFYAIGELGRLFTYNAAVRDNHAIIETGPYRWLRHPGYAGVLLVCFGYGVALCNVLSIVAAVALITYALKLRIGVEEALLSERVPGYRQYMERTWRVIPWVW